MSANDEILSAAQCRAARALTNVSRAVLAERSGIDEAGIREFENKIADPATSVRTGLRMALESMGAQFIDDDSHGGQGVRFKFTASEAARIEGLENEGGPIGEDDVKD